MDSYRCIFLLLVSALILVNVEASDDKFTRQLTQAFNCTSEDQIKIVSIKAAGPHDDLFHIWDSSGSFTIMMLRLPKHTSLEHSCSKLLKNDFKDAVKFNDTIDYSFAVVLDKLIEFDDDGDTGKFVPGTGDSSNFSFSDFSWTTELTEKEDSISMKYSLIADKTELGENDIELELTLFNNNDRSNELPRLAHTANSTVVNFVLNHATVQYNHSRFGVVVYLLNGNNTYPFIKSVEKLVDDEYTPGVFRMVQVSTEEDLSGYMQWKPTVYTTYEHKHESSTETQESDVYNNIEDQGALAESIANAIYGDNITHMNQSMMVTFGMPRDNFYESANYSSWTFSIGCGEAPTDKISASVIIILAVGLGILVLLMLAGACYIMFRNFKAKQDDLLLSN